MARLRGALLTLGTTLALAAAPEAAAREFNVGFQDPAFTSPASGTRALWLDRARAAGAGLVRLNIRWNLVVGSTPPADPRNPADPAYSFALLDSALRDIVARGLQPLVTVGEAPRWAEGPGRPGLDIAPKGSWKPDPAAYGDFAAALATRYSGLFDPQGPATVLPRVWLFQALNEPNLPTYLSPQWSGRRPVSPGHYRQLLNSFYSAVKSVDTSNLVLSAGTAPYGSRPGGRRMRPITFWRSLLCMKQKRGKLRPRRCEDPARLDVAAHHPITGAPRSRAAHAGDVTIPELGQLRRLVRSSERAHNVLPAGRRPLWVTELWWETRPPDRVAGVSLRKQARWIAEGFYLIWKRGISVAILHLIRDQRFNPANPFATFQSGVYFAGGTPKPALRAVQFPFVTRRRSPARLAVWGRAPESGALTIKRRHHGKWRRVRRLRVDADRVFRTTVRARGPATLRARVAGQRSATWRQRR